MPGHPGKPGSPASTGARIVSSVAPRSSPRIQPLVPRKKAHQDTFARGARQFHQPNDLLQKLLKDGNHQVVEIAAEAIDFIKETNSLQSA